MAITRAMLKTFLDDAVMDDGGNRALLFPIP
jgi:hypothetical protein